MWTENWMPAIEINGLDHSSLSYRPFMYHNFLTQCFPLCGFKIL